MNSYLKESVPPQFRKTARSILQNLHLIDLPNSNVPENILNVAHRRIGVGNYENDAVSGESFLIDTVLPSLITESAPIVFDVGANVGNYTLAVLQTFKDARIHAFEPSPETYVQLQAALGHRAVACIQKGLSNAIGFASIFDYGDQPGSQHASLHRGVIDVLHGADQIRAVSIELTTVDDYCSSQGIGTIDFIKIDTEGNELAVLKGASLTIARGGLPFIQFEFNEMNVFSRTFLKDFYDLLSAYEFFRVMPTGLLPLGRYNPRNEIFAFQNLVALCPVNYPLSRVSPFLVPTMRIPPKI